MSSSQNPESSSASGSQNTLPPGSQNVLPSVSLKDLEKLAGQSNFLRWRSTIQKVLKYQKVLDITKTKQEMPTSDAAADALEMKNLQALLTMQATISLDQQYLISECETANQAWTNLHDAFDRQNTISSFYQMRLMNDLRQSENDTIPDYVHRYGTLWTQTHSRFSNSTDALSKVLKPVYEDDTFKTAMFLASLHPSLNDIVDNLNTKSNLTYADATAQLLSMRSSNIDTAKALNAIQKRNKGKSANTSSRKPNPPGQGKTAPPNKGECSCVTV
ncbi:hypothetical protein L211DRAFT_845271 [Terfezia boudieri ATCC MYA-4762]|uniref:Retrotransposon Copia-like N-terminal domain-containing protein n=1 Tax=Terfezia boudieri ATCC MYA-4762 TaxID=1051890 RepID=A0A3N4M286_9PEZI|nr:hypothetical protein L211DRAFT_845271 [Terfezia boudieri ATCC MYA-4762]